jgi:hypothetical protein
VRRGGNGGVRLQEIEKIDREKRVKEDMWKRWKEEV